MSSKSFSQSRDLAARRLIAAAVGAALGSGALSTQVLAEESGVRELPKITVQGAEASRYKVDESASRKYTAPLLDTPQTVSVIPASLIKEQGTATLRDVLRNTPGITFQAGEGGGGLPGDQNFTLRGFSARNSLHIDGIRDIGAYTRDAFNLEQVEVAKGPGSTFAGRSSTAGVINQVTKTPQAQAFSDFTLGFGNDSYERATADLNQPFGDRHGLRMNLMYHDADVPERNVVTQERFGIAPSLALGLGEDTRLTLSYLYLEEDNVPDYGLPWAAFEASPPVDRSTFYGLENYDFEDVESRAATVQLTHAFGEHAVLENVTRHLDTTRDSAITAPRPPNRQLHRRTMGTENLANHTNLGFSLGTGGVEHRFSTGLELARERTDNRNSAQATNQPRVPGLFNPDPRDRPLGPMPPNTGNPGRADVDTLALYAFDTLTLSERWQLSGGVRWEQVDVDYRLTNLAARSVTRLQRDDSMLSWQAGVVFKPRDAGSVYFGYGTSFDPSVDAGSTGAGFGTTPTSANAPTLDPEESRNYELGTKWELAEGRLALNGALFRTEKTNARTRTSTSEPYVLGGEQRVQGIELGASGTLAEGLSVFGGYAYMDSEIERSANPLEQSQQLLLTPRHSFNLWTTYEFRALTLGAGTQFLDSLVRSRSSTTGVENELPSYWLVELMGAYRVTDSVTLRLNVSNLTDEEYVDRVGGGHYVPGPGRAAWLTADVRFARR